MANPNRCMARVAKRSPIEEKRFPTLFAAQCYADEQRAKGYDARATQRKIGPRAAPVRLFYCYTYEKLTTE